MSDRNGAELLAEWLDREGRKKIWLAERVATSQKTLGWWLSGRAVPSASHAAHLETLTGGEIPASAWGRK